MTSGAGAVAGEPVPAAQFIAAADGRAAAAPVVTVQAFVTGGLFPAVPALVAALRALRGAGRTEDVVGLAIPLEGDDPAAGMVRQRRDAPVKRRFDLLEFLATAIDPHKPAGWVDAVAFAPGKNTGLAVELLGDLTRWLVGILPFRVPDVPGAGSVWVLGRPNHAAAIQALPGDSQEGPVGMLVTIGVPADLGLLFAERLAAGDCILTTCETDGGRARRDQRLMRRAGATYLFDPVLLVRQYGVRTT